MFALLREGEVSALHVNPDQINRRLIHNSFRGKSDILQYAPQDIIREWLDDNEYEHELQDAVRKSSKPVIIRQLHTMLFFAFHP